MERKLGRERCDSAGDSVEEHMKRKREMLGRESLGGEREEMEVFKRSKKTVKSPKEGEAIREWRKMLREMEEEIKEGIEGVRKEIREIAEGQREAMRTEIEEMRKDLRRREDR